MSVARHSIRTSLGIVDHLYRRWHRLSPVGPLLFVGRMRYTGAERRFADGTELKPGDALGTLHFNNARIAALDGTSPGATGLGFRRLLFASLKTLAERTRQDEPFCSISAFRGLGWLRHGERIGFVHEPISNDWRTRYAVMHVRLLVWAFAPPGGTAIDARPELTVTWLTRRALLERFGHEGRHG